MADGHKVVHRRLSRDYSDSSDESDKEDQRTTPKKTNTGPPPSNKVPEKNGLVLKPSLSLEPYDVAFKVRESFFNLFLSFT